MASQQPVRVDADAILMAPVLGLARDGWPILGIFLAGTAAVCAAGFWWLGPWGAVPGGVATLLSAWCAWFFRDPERATPTDGGAVVSAADGVVCFVGPGTPPPELGVDPGDASGMTRVSVFMNVFNVHVNRAPLAGRVERVAYRPGRFFNASFDKASEHNERLGLSLRLSDGRLMVVVQIAGLVARRIVCRAREGVALKTGQRFGMIRFGSRVDVYLPREIAPLVSRGQRTVAGVTVLARAGEVA